MPTVAPRRVTETRAILQARILGLPVAHLYHPELAQPVAGAGPARRLPALDPSGIGPLVGPVGHDR